MTRGEIMVMKLCLTAAVLVLLGTAVVSGGLFVIGTGAHRLLDSSLTDVAPVQQPVRFDGPVDDEHALPLDQARADAIEAARRALDSRPQLEPLPLPAVQVGNSIDLSRLFEQVSPGVVAIEVERLIGPMRAGGEGSGFIIDQRHIVTNNHVVDGVNRVVVIFNDGRRRSADVVGTDVFSDLAVLRVADMPSGVRPLPLLADFNSLRVGEIVVAIGNPFGLASTMTSGIISALGRTIPDGMTPFSIPQSIQTDAAINPGNSGGPLINARGQVIGVNAQIRTQGAAANAGVGFAIPASIVARVVPVLVAGNSYEWAYLGVSGAAVHESIASARGLEPDTGGAYIDVVLGNGPSAGRLRGTTTDQQRAQGINAEPEPDGDIIIAIDNMPVRNFDDLLTYIALESEPGATVELTVLRDGERVMVPLELGARPRDAGPRGNQQR